MAVTCVTQSHCSPEHHGVLRRWPLVSLEAEGQVSAWDRAKKPSWEWDPHLQWDTGWVCEVTSNSNTNNSNINEQTPLCCKVFYCIWVQGHVWSNVSSLLKSPSCCNEHCCWGLGSGNFLVTCLFVPDYSILLPRCISELLSAAGALVNSPDELRLCSLEKVGFVENLLTCHCPSGEVHAYGSVIMCGCTTLQHSYWEKEEGWGFFYCAFFVP